MYEYSSSADERLEELRESDVRVNYKGTVEWHPMAIYKSTCSVQIKYFPFDKQACKLKFGPWTHDGPEYSLFQQAGLERGEFRFRLRGNASSILMRQWVYR
ncbi:unnamed protein product [Protopolystoma xenopodis]|uniref:Neurotransmitter-gated ion-channel ligand-binding domain-containing protein n=1 Tax=Protopolystoma xenopodis TaxID=117903 RepID=A0A448WEC6_9PLAT|nr:unnamed protein product [Protopolystoma xenopodis]